MNNQYSELPDHVTEDSIEGYLTKIAPQLGFLCYKFISPSHRAVPDRILIGHGHIFFIELKAPGKKAREQQTLRIAEMREHKAPVYILDNQDDIRKILLYYRSKKKKPLIFEEYHT